jgi:hypothetical protein
MGPVTPTPEPPRRARHPEVVSRIARYLYCWGLTDGPALAAATTALLRRAVDAGRAAPAEQIGFVMDEVEAWVGRLVAAANTTADAELCRLGIVARLPEALHKYPDAFMADRPPADFVEVLAKPTPRLTPAPISCEMSPCNLGRQPTIFRAGFWVRLLRWVEAHAHAHPKKRDTPPTR